MEREEPEEDAAWRAIVENYGEPVLADEPVEQAVRPPTPPAPASYDRPDPRRDAITDDTEDANDLVDPDDRFVPPVPPPVPRPTADRLVAWLGVFLAPAVLLAFVIAGYQPPDLLGWLLVAWFVGGFLYLVVRMPGSPRDPFDDGAQV